MDHLDEDVLSQLAAGVLPQDQAIRATAHMSECAVCAARHEAVAAVLFSKTFAAPLRTPAPTRAAPATTRPDGVVVKGEDGTDKITGRVMHRGTAVGRYVVLEKLGAGGMGEVFAAYDPQLDRKVALKLLRVGTVSADEGKARLLREAQAMARLSHPNVVAVHDVGTYEDRVFVAMEFVDGETLTEWLRSRPGWEKIRSIFVESGRGLAAAHRAGIIHRDFKPDNVLIGSDGRARVLDFGLARQDNTPQVVREQPGAEHTPIDGGFSSPLTRDGAVMGTPGYMAPEQLGGLATDARSDQFSFCVALYEALYGKRPFSGTTLRLLADDMMKGAPPSPPSQSEAPEEIFSVLKRGLSPEPKDRFESMEALLAQLQPKRRGSRLKLVAALTVVSVLATLAVGYGVQARRRLQVCGSADRPLTETWNPAVKNRLKKNFLTTGLPYAESTWKSVEPVLDSWSKSWSRTAVEICEAAHVRKTDSEEVWASKQGCLEDSLRALRSRLHQLEAADTTIVRNAIPTVRGLPDVAECLNSVVKKRPAELSPALREKNELLKNALLEARTLHDAGRYQKGIEVLEAALGPTSEGAPAVTRAEALLLLGRLQDRGGKTKEAQKTLFLAALAAETAGDAGLLARAFSRLAMLSGFIDADFDKAASYKALADAVFQRALADRETDAELQINSGLVALRADDPKTALQDFAGALDAQRSLYGDDDPEVARTHNNLGKAYAELRNFAGARGEFERAVAIQEKQLGRSHPDTASSLTNLAMMNSRDGRLSDALTLHQEVLKIREGSLGAEHPDTATTLVLLGNLQRKMESPESALASLNRALAIREKVSGPKSVPVAMVLDDLARFYLSQGYGKEALSHAERALALFETLLGRNHKLTSQEHDQVAQAHQLLGHSELALAQANLALEARREKSGPQSHELALSLNTLGGLMLAQNHTAKALESYAMAAMIDATDDEALAKHLRGIGRCELKLGHADKAFDAFSKAVTLREKGEDPQELALARFEVAKAQYDAQPFKHAEAVELAQSTHDTLAKLVQPELEAWLQSHPPR